MHLLLISMAGEKAANIIKTFNKTRVRMKPPSSNECAKALNDIYQRCVAISNRKFYSEHIHLILSQQSETPKRVTSGGPIFGA